MARSWNYENKAVQDQLEQARAMTDMQARYKLYQEIEETIVYKDFAFIPLFHLEHLFVVQPRVQELQGLVERLEQYAVLRDRDRRVKKPCRLLSGTSAGGYRCTA